MMPKFPDQAERKDPDKADYQEVYYRLFKSDPAKKTIKQLKHAIKTLGRCECGCKRPLSSGFDMQHLPPVWSLTKGQEQMFYAWRPDCHLIDSKKQSGKCAKSKRVYFKKQQYDKRKANGGSRIKGRSSFPTGRKIQSRGFNKRLRKKMDGTVEVRDAN